MEPTIDKSMIHQQHEFIRLDNENKEWKLNPGMAFKTLRDETASTTTTSEERVFIVSIIGNTQAGKSFTIRQLLSLLDNEVSAPFVADRNADRPTSCDITCFKAKNITPPPISTFLLDYEGEKSGQSPLLKFQQDVKQRDGWDYNYSNEEIVERRKSVERLFPQLAYTLSNVVILVSSDTFATSTYSERCITLAKCATSCHKIHYRPVLICISNFAQLDPTSNVKEVTAKFKKQADFNELSKYFSDIICFRLPNKRVSTHADGFQINGEDIFNNQIAELKEQLVQIHKAQRFRLLTFNQWLSLAESLMEKISRGDQITMPSILYSVLKSNRCPEYEVVESLFKMLYACEVEIHPRRWYHFCRRFATKALARSYAMRLPPSSTLNDVIYRDCEVRLKVLWSNLEQWIPCEAIYFGPGHPKNENHIVFCGQYKSKHGHCHYTSEPVYLNDSWFAWLFHDSKSDKWGEHFETNDCTTNEPSSEMIAEFFKDVENALEHGTIDVCSTFYKLLSDHQLIHLISNPRSDSDRFICYCCLTNENSSSHRTRRQILGKTINHRRIFCSSCLRKLRQLKSKTDDIGYRTRVVPKYDDKCASCATEKRHAAFYPCGHYGFCRACAMKMEVEPAVCPVCRSQIKKVVKILNVQDKFVGMNEPNIELSGEATEGEGDAHSALREDDCV